MLHTEAICSVPFHLVITSNLQRGSIVLIGVLMKSGLFCLNLGRSLVVVVLLLLWSQVSTMYRWGG